jgi:hypothetical protein
VARARDDAGELLILLVVGEVAVGELALEAGAVGEERLAEREDAGAA